MNRAMWVALLAMAGACELDAGDGLLGEDELDAELDSKEASVLVGGVDIAIPNPFQGKWFGSRRVELPLGMNFGSGASALTLPTGDTLDPMLAELGNLLFFDKRLSKTNAMSCATCHDPASGYSVKTFSKGVAGNVLPRTTPSSMNRLFGTKNNWIGQRTLEQQSSAPITAAAEMGLTSAQLLAAVSANTGYVDRLNRLVAAGVLTAPAVSVANVERAIATFQRLDLMTGNSAVDRFEAGDPAALTAAQKRGRNLFLTKNCVQCHSGDNYTNEGFHRIVPSTKDKGRQLVTGLAADAFKFKTPTLRNVALRGPYFHDGDPFPDMATTLETVVRRYNSGGTAGSDPLLTPQGMSTSDQADLVAFLKGLTGTIPVDPWLSQDGVVNSGANREGIYLSPAVFDTQDYQAAYADLAGMTATQVRGHWLTTGMAEGRRGVDSFDAGEYLQLYTTTYDAVNASPDRFKLAIDDYLNSGRAKGRVGRYKFVSTFFSVADYRSLNGRTTALMTEDEIRQHYVTVGQTSRLPAKVKPTGYFIVASATPSYHYADGAAYCSFASAAAQRTSRGRGDEVGVPRLGFAPSNLTNGGACITSTSPPTPTTPGPAAASGTIVPFSCQVEGSNAGCSKVVTCPAGMKVKTARAACNLEFGAVTDVEFANTAWGVHRTPRKSDVVNQGHCMLDAMDLNAGVIGILPPVTPDRMTVACSENDDNGGDCHIRGELLCAP